VPVTTYRSSAQPFELTAAINNLLSHYAKANKNVITINSQKTSWAG
jgi:hypothetical protein